jgi:hypothetical protein
MGFMVPEEILDRLQVGGPGAREERRGQEARPARVGLVSGLAAVEGAAAAS